MAASTIRHSNVRKALAHVAARRAARVAIAEGLEALNAPAAPLATLFEEQDQLFSVFRSDRDFARLAAEHPERVLPGAFMGMGMVLVPASELRASDLVDGSYLKWCERNDYMDSYDLAWKDAEAQVARLQNEGWRNYPHLIAA